LVIGLNLLANNITNFVWSDAYHSFTVLPLDNLTKMNVKLIKQFQFFSLLSRQFKQLFWLKTVD